MARPSFVEISESALTHNLDCVRQTAGGARVWAVVKADAYGHGLQIACKAFAAADGLALVEFDGAKRLREMGWQKPILMLDGAFDADDQALAQQLDLSLVVHSQMQLELLRNAHSTQALALYLKYNSGLNRLGFDAEQFLLAHQTLQHSGRARRIDLMTHFANSEVPGGTDAALAEFLRVTEGLKGDRSACNSAAIISVAAAHQDWVRPGVMLYGATPFNDRPASSLGLRPAMRLGSKLIAIQQLRTGAGVGYGWLFKAPEPMRIGVIACGYADGYPRHAGPNTPILVAGQRSRLVGRVAMDMMMVDLRPVADPKIGDEVELWGSNIAIDEVAQASATIGYELMCAIAPRVQRLLKP
jgi:alanine racemase